MEETMIDPLTGVGNRRRLDAQLPIALSAGRGLSLVMVDLDHFKSVNDTHGHPAGDKLLQQVAAVIRDTIRPGDSVYRFGGEEFCVLLADTGGGLAKEGNAGEAAEVAERIRGAIAERGYDVGIGTLLRVTASLGVATAIDGDGAALLARADAALYVAKNAGRNRVSSA
jgi:two-component system cell cycle response regulator